MNDVDDQKQSAMAHVITRLFQQGPDTDPAEINLAYQILEILIRNNAILGKDIETLIQTKYDAEKQTEAHKSKQTDSEIARTTFFPAKNLMNFVIELNKKIQAEEAAEQDKKFEPKDFKENIPHVKIADLESYLSTSPEIDMNAIIANGFTTDTFLKHMNLLAGNRRLTSFKFVAQGSVSPEEQKNFNTFVQQGVLDQTLPVLPSTLKVVLISCANFSDEGRKPCPEEDHHLSVCEKQIFDLLLRLNFLERLEIS